MDLKQQKPSDDRATETLLERAVRQSLKRRPDNDNAEDLELSQETRAEVPHEDPGNSVH